MQKTVADKNKRKPDNKGQRAAAQTPKHGQCAAFQELQE